MPGSSTLWDSVRQVTQAAFRRQVDVAGTPVQLPWSLKYRLGIVLGNARLQRLLDVTTQPGDTVVDVGAHVGYNTVYAAARVGPTGLVYAIEPAPDNVIALKANVAASGLTNITVLQAAAGAGRGERDLFLRGSMSAVNSFSRASCYAPVTSSTRVRVAPVDELVATAPDVVKIDVEGSELEVLAGMSRILETSGIRVIVEWHPVLQQMAGLPADALPKYLLGHGLTLRASRYSHLEAVDACRVESLMAHLLRCRGSIDLLGTRHSDG